jgi:hypothetical protein
MDLAIQGRLGLIIDGTGRDYDKIIKQSNMLRELGYDTYMIFVNTSLEVALARNAERRRKVPEAIAKQAWHQVQNNMGRYQNHFGQNNFILVDNNNATENVLNKVYKRVAKVVDRPVQNHIGKQWMQKELEVRNRLKNEAAGEASMGTVSDYLSGDEKPTFNRRGAVRGFAGDAWISINGRSYRINPIRAGQNKYMILLTIDGKKHQFMGSGPKAAFMKMVKELSKLGYK